MDCCNSIMQKMVSAIITTHNRKDLVLKAIESVENQTYSNIELIVVDDASSADNMHYLETLAVEKRFVYVFIPQNESKGGNHARNVGIQNSNGEYIAFLDDDDEWMPEKIEKQVLYLEQHKECSIVHCGIAREYDFETVEHSDLATLSEGDCRSIIWWKHALFTSSMMVRREIFDEIGFFDENLRYWQDYEFFIRAFEVSDLGVVREELVLYRVISSDKNRLTNNLDGWKKAVEYIEEKHSNKIARLDKEQLKLHQQDVCIDGARRAKRVKDYHESRRFFRRRFFLAPSTRHFLQWILNSEKLREYWLVKTLFHS